MTADGDVINERRGCLKGTAGSLVGARKLDAKLAVVQAPSCEEKALDAFQNRRSVSD